jgi:hypothetical protein
MNHQDAENTKDCKKVGMEEKRDYQSALQVKRKNKKWTSHKELKEALGIR